MGSAPEDQRIEALLAAAEDVIAAWRRKQGKSEACARLDLAVEDFKFAQAELRAMDTY